VIDDPALISQQRSHSPVSITAILAGQFDDPGSQDFFVIWNSFMIPLRGSWLTDYLTGSSFGDPQLLLQMSNASAAAVGA
jgi:hypothetical protein